MTLRQQLSFPRQYARTQRFTLGAPRAFTVSPDGARVVFLRSADGTDRVNRLWVLDLDGGTAAGGGSAERIAADPATLLAGATERLSAEERARRERSREGAAGIVGYAVDSAVELAAFALSGRLFAAELRAGTARALPVRGPVIDPRPSPDGRHIAYTVRGALRVVGADGEGDRALAAPGAVRTRRTSRTAGRSSSRPRRWTARAATGGRPSPTGCSSPASTRPRCGAGGRPIRRTRTGSR